MSLHEVRLRRVEPAFERLKYWSGIPTNFILLEKKKQQQLYANLTSKTYQVKVFVTSVSMHNSGPGVYL